VTDLRLPPIQAVIELQAEWIAEHGGAPGLRDRGALEGALARAHQILAYDPDAGLVAVAAAVCVSICRNHPFVDGNKRAAFGVMGIVLELNGSYLDVAERDATRTMLALAAGELAEDAFREWVAANVVVDD